jgi:UDP:flavonoid glycosyltransferase YjiC (YdhE family)
MRRASVVLTHGGHGTFMRALKHGLPMVIVPGLGGDQPINAAAAEAWGVGRSLPRGDADPASIAAAVQQVLGAESYRQRAQAIARDLAAADGARDGAAEIEALLASRV